MSHDTHAVLGTSLTGPWPDGYERAVFAMGCFWGAERLFWELPGVYSTAAGYTGGTTQAPSYREVCTGTTGHAEAVQVIYDPAAVGYETLLKTFWENHDPTQGNRQGNDIGSQYRSAVYATTDAQLATALASRDTYAPVISRPITTQITRAEPFYLAEPEHQQYLHHHPNGYCNHGPQSYAGVVPLTALSKRGTDLPVNWEG